MQGFQGFKSVVGGLKLFKRQRICVAWGLKNVGRIVHVCEASVRDARGLGEGRRDSGCTVHACSSIRCMFGFRMRNFVIFCDIFGLRTVFLRIEAGAVVKNGNYGRNGIDGKYLKYCAR